MQPRRLRLVALLGLVGLVAAAAWYGLRPSDRVTVVVDDREPAASPPPPIAVDVTSTADPVVDPSDAPREGVTKPGEVLRPLPAGARPRMARFPREGFRGGGEVSGADLLDAIVAGGELWVRFDAAETRDAFRAARFPLPGFTVLESGEPVAFLQALPDVLRHVGFSTRVELDGSLLRIGGKDVYPEVPPPEAVPGDPVPSPR